MPLLCAFAEQLHVSNSKTQGFGSLVAGPDFPSDAFLLVIGIKGSCNVPQGSCNVDINFPALFMDGANRAAGCMQINNVMGVTIGPGGYFLNFTQRGVEINAGHEVMIDRVRPAGVTCRENTAVCF